MQTTLWTPKAEKAEFWNTLLFFSKRGGTHLSASLPGSLVASDALGSARSGFEATPVVDAGPRQERIAPTATPRRTLKQKSGGTSRGVAAVRGSTQTTAGFLRNGGTL